MLRFSVKNILNNPTFKNGERTVCVHRFFVYLSAVKTIPSLLTKGILYALIAFVLNRTIA